MITTMKPIIEANYAAQIDQLTKERDELKAKLDDESLNRIGCEYAMIELRRCCGMDTTKTDLREVKLHIDELKASLEHETACANSYHSRWQRAEGFRDEAVTRAEKAAAAGAEMRGLLSVDGCVVPGCGGQGWYPVAGQDQYGEPEQQQERCQWCDEKKHALSHQCGTGWLSPEKAGRLIGEFKHLLNRAEYVCLHDWSVGAPHGTRIIALQDLLAGLKEAKQALAETTTEDGK